MVKYLSHVSISQEGCLDYSWIHFHMILSIGISLLSISVQCTQLNTVYEAFMLICSFIYKKNMPLPLDTLSRQTRWCRASFLFSTQL